jgi:hypothetical protein
MQDLFGEFEEESKVEASKITLQQLDEYVKKLVDLRADYEAKKKAASEANGKAEEMENFIMGILDELGRTSYDAEGIGKVTKVIQSVYKVPKETFLKKELFDYIKEKYGPEVLMNMVSINHQTLNSWAKQELMEVQKIPGLELPTPQEYIQLRRK